MSGCGIETIKWPLGSQSGHFGGLHINLGNSGKACTNFRGWLHSDQDTSASCLVRRPSGCRSFIAFDLFHSYTLRKQIFTYFVRSIPVAKKMMYPGRTRYVSFFRKLAYSKATKILIVVPEAY